MAELAHHVLMPQYIPEVDGPAAKAAATKPSVSGPLISMRGVRREYSLGHTTVRALRGVDLDIQAGEMVAVWGPSGSGKSTLMNIIGLVDKHDEGTVLIAGQDISQLTDNMLADYRSQEIGFIFQSFNLLPVLSVVENVMLPLQVQGIPTGEARCRAENLLSSVGLAEFFRFRPDRLSGGQRQRTAIARALVTKPSLVIADEPTANLDSENGDQIVKLMSSLQASTGTTFVFSTHDPRLLEKVPRILELRDGSIHEDKRQEVS